jgi:hypothetical protein
MSPAISDNLAEYSNEVGPFLPLNKPARRTSSNGVGLIKTLSTTVRVHLAPHGGTGHAT